MAVARTTSEPKKSMLITLVVFIVLFLAAAVLAVMFYMKQSQLISDRDRSQKDLRDIASPSELVEIKPLLAGGRVGVTAVGRLKEDMRFIGGLVLGQDLSGEGVVGLRDRAAAGLGPLQELLNEVTQLQLLPPEELKLQRGLAPLVATLVQLTKTLVDRMASADYQAAQQYEKSQQTVETFKNANAELTEKLTLSLTSERAQEETYKQWRDQSATRYEQMVQKLETDKQQAQQQADKLTQENQALRKEIEKYQATVGQLNQRLQQFQPKPETEMAALEPDGYIVRVDERDQVAYINLTRAEPIYRGLTFAVYDRFQPIPKSGKGKGALEVIEIQDTFSKCRVTQYDRTNPITEGDIIANLVWSRDKKFRFCLAGTFDLNGDGAPDADGLQQLTRLIERWGGVVTEAVSVDTDFFAVGAAPALPVKPSDEFTASAEAVQAFRQAQERLTQYEQNRQAAVALGVPTFNLSRFLYFIGYYGQSRLSG